MKTAHHIPWILIVSSFDPLPYQGAIFADAAQPVAAAAKSGEEIVQEEIPAALAAAAGVPHVIAEQAHQTRRRMLDCMQFVGQLFKCGDWITKRIMNDIVQQLLQVGGG